MAHKVNMGDQLWAITDAGLSQLQAQLQVQVDFSASDGEDAAPANTMLEKYGDVGIITIDGPLINTDNFFTRMLGLASYPQIRESLLMAAEDKDIKKIVLNLSSPGGTVLGLDETAQLIQAVDRRVKPVFAYGNGLMASAAYWLGSTAREVHTSRMSQVGSIGVISTSVEFSKAMEAQGITPTVIRAGKYKQMGNPYEPLSEEGREELQSMVDDIYNVFVQHVARNRGTSVQVVRENMADGRVFLGNKARDKGLVDKVSNFETFLSYVSRYDVDKKRNMSKNTRIGANAMTQSNISMNEDLMAAMVAAGEEVALEDTVEVKQDKVDDAAIDGSKIETSAVTKDDIALEDKVEVKVEGVDEGVEALADTNDVIESLVAKLEATEAEVVQAKVQIATLEANLAKQQETQEALSEVVARSVNSMNVALGRSAQSFEGWDGKMVLTAYNSTATDFKSNFKAGGVAAVVTHDKPQAQKKMSAHELARIKATQL